MIVSRAFLAAAAGFFFLSPAPASAEPPPAKAPKVAKAIKAKKGSKKGEAKGKVDEDPAFAARLAALQKSTGGLIEVKMRPVDDPTRLPEHPLGPGLVVVANTRRGIYTPPVLSTEDLLSVVQENMVAIRKCYKQQLADDPEWAGEMILDLSVKKSGRVSEVEIAPGRVRRDVIGQCLLSEIPRWKFPEFTGEMDDGITQEVVNASFPLSFGVR